ncbi:hypothetical protein GCM10007989_36030 [Devosia pacifica]|uniref:Uncharacterized protein n=1 Tax=Devosia pacifica TaxID=1335967 RepID=A0A918SES5_9HYPH|nr:hypothetical protein [Devosia pacifica]GHA36698.1 hypothetical protein GCM10007989_36030 [Devosia pacifica]
MRSVGCCTDTIRDVETNGKSHARSLRGQRIDQIVKVSIALWAGLTHPSKKIDEQNTTAS